MIDIHFFKLSRKQVLKMSGPTSAYSVVAVSLFDTEEREIDLKVEIGQELMHVRLGVGQKCSVRFCKWGTYAEISFVQKDIDPTGEGPDEVMLRIHTCQEITLDLIEGDAA